MSNINNLSPEQIKIIGNYTKEAAKSFEENIVSQHNFLEKAATTHKLLNSKKK